MSEYSKQELIRKCKKQNRRAQMQLYDELSDYLFTISYRILKDEMQAQDLMQEVMIQFLEKSIYQLQKPEMYVSFLKRMTVNRSINEWKKKTYFLDIEELEKVEEDEEEGYFEGNWEQVLQEMKSLPEKYRMMIELYYLQEYSHKEISEMLGIGYSNSRVMLKRAVDQLKKKCYENTI